MLTNIGHKQLCGVLEHAESINLWHILSKSLRRITHIMRGILISLPGLRFYFVLKNARDTRYIVLENLFLSRNKYLRNVKGID